MGGIGSACSSRPLPIQTQLPSWVRIAMIQPAEPNPTPGATDPGSHFHDDPDKLDQHFLALGPALRIVQLNVEGLSAAKRDVISKIAAEHPML